MKLIKILSPAKINLALQIINKRKDAFHNINTIFMKIPFYDELIFENSDRTEIISNPKLNIQNEDNLIFKSITLLKKKCNIQKNIKVVLNKNIPMGGGLGGGSSNAATSLVTLNKIWDLKLEIEDLIEFGLELGSDVPFFIFPFEVAIGKGRGEILSVLNLNLNCHILLITNNIHISTKEAYSNVNLSNNVAEINFKELFEKKVELKNILFNDFEEPVFQSHPELMEIKKHLFEHGALYSGMSGSGSSMFGLFHEHQQLLSAKDSLEFVVNKFPDFSFQTYIFNSSVI